MNSGYESSSKKIIKCLANSDSTEGPCVKLINNEITSCSNAGCINVNNNEITLYLTDSCDNGDKIILSDEVLYKTITIINDNDFPGANRNNSVPIKIGKGSVILLEDTSLPLCTNSLGNNACFTDAINGQYCIQDRKIYETKIDESGTTCTLMTGSEKSIFYFDDAYEKVENPSTRNDIMAYKCEFSSENVLLLCELVKGYIIESDKYIQCNGWKSEGCIVEAIQSSEGTCSNSNYEGILLSNPKALCFGTEINKITETIDYIAFMTKDINIIYGIGFEEIVFLSVTENVITVTKDSSKLLLLIKKKIKIVNLI